MLQLTVSQFARLNVIERAVSNVFLALFSRRTNTSSVLHALRANVCVQVRLDQFESQFLHCLILEICGSTTWVCYCLKE